MPALETMAAVSAVFSAIPTSVLDSAGKSLKHAKNKILARYESSFATHVHKTLEKSSHVQTIFTDQKKVPIRSIYTNLYIDGIRKIRDDDILPRIDDLGNIVVSGTGGAGKTMLMKYLALNSIEYPTGRIPLLIELRNLPDHIPAQFNRTVFEYCNDFHDRDEYGLFREGLRQGMFLIFFDGLDEVPSERRDQVFNSIKRMAREFKNSRIIASSRPEIDTRNWGELTTHNVLGLTSNQAKDLIRKIDFPNTLKDEFIGLMDRNFFQKHESFLSVPLLCSLMLLTYHEYQSIPSRITVFYDQAFETLMRRHDRSKEGFFKRQLDSGLSSDRFRMIFAAFCYRTLAKQEISFSDENFRHHLSRAADATEIEVDVDCLASDLVSHVCVVMRDGLNLHFIHRSFQEYFAAVYLIRYRGGDAVALYDRLFEALNVNDVALMAYDMDVQAFEREWALPACTRIREKLEKYEEPERPIQLLLETWYTLRIDANDQRFSAFSWMGGGTTHETLHQLSRVYSDEFPDLRIIFSGEVHGEENIRDIIEKYNDPMVIDSIYRTQAIEEDSGHVEFTMEGHNLDWIKETSMYEELESCLTAIFALHSELESRVSKREEIDLLQ